MAHVSQAISPVVQLPGTHQCWAAVVAMMLRRPGPDNQTIIHQIISEARERRVPMGMGGDSLDATSGPPMLARAFGFNYIDLRGLPSLPDGNYFAAFLRMAPFGILGLRPGYGLHAIAVNRLDGDFAALGSTRAHGIDPMAGGHPFSRLLFNLVAPTLQPGADFVGHCVISR
jgi:hypothetical protein